MCCFLFEESYRAIYHSRYIYDWLIYIYIYIYGVVEITKKISVWWSRWRTLYKVGFINFDVALISCSCVTLTGWLALNLNTHKTFTNVIHYFIILNYSFQSTMARLVECHFLVHIWTNVNLLPFVSCSISAYRKREDYMCVKGQRLKVMMMMMMLTTMKILMLMVMTMIAKCK